MIAESQTSNLKYYFEVRVNGMITELPIPNLNNKKITSRALTINVMNTAKKEKVNSSMRKLMTQAGVFFGVCFEIDGKRYPIEGFDGGVKHKELIENKMLELEIYRANGWEAETELIYSVDKKENVEVIKHRDSDGEL